MLVSLAVLAEPGMIWDFGSGAGRAGDGGFLLGNSSATNGEWIVGEASLRFRNAHLAQGADQNNYTEAAAVVPLAEHGWQPGEDFTLSLVVDFQGVGDWNRIGFVAFAPDMRGHEYRDRGFHFAGLRVHGNNAYSLRIGNDFGADRSHSSLPMDGPIQDGTYRLALAGTNHADGSVTLRLECQREGDEHPWIIEQTIPAPPPDRLHFGFGGRFRAIGANRYPVVDFRQFRFSPGAPAPAEAEADPIVFAGTWNWEGRAQPYRVSLRRAAHRFRPLPTAVYLRNPRIPRIGTDSDEAIVADLLEDGMLVIELDCAGLPGGFPDLPEAIMVFNENLVGQVTRLSRGMLVPDLSHLYWLPAGYRLQRNLPFWNIERHGAPGTMEHIVHIFNTHLAERLGVEPLTSPDQLRGPNGEPLDYNLHLDIVYPSGSPARPVPLIAHFSTQCRLSRSFREHRAIYPLSWLVSGYALTYVDHVYNPLARSSAYGHFRAYSLQNSNGLAAGSAAIRFLRTEAQRFNLNGAIGALGHSKSSYTVVRLADPRHPEQGESSTFAAAAEQPAREQPWPGQSSEIAVAYASMGDGTRRVRLYDPAMVPLFIAVGRHDQYNEWPRFPPLVAACEARNLHHHALWMEELGHTFPMGVDGASGRNRTAMVVQFFDQHLHPRQQPDPLEVLALIPAEGNGTVGPDGSSRFILATDDELPPDMHGLSTDTPITLVFARKVDPATLGPDTASLRQRQTGTPVPGQWRPSLQNSRFQFLPDQPLRPATEYEILLSPGIRDEFGLTLADPVHRRFRTREW